MRFRLLQQITSPSRNKAVRFTMGSWADGCSPLSGGRVAFGNRSNNAHPGSGSRAPACATPGPAERQLLRLQARAHRLTARPRADGGSALAAPRHRAADAPPPLSPPQEAFQDAAERADAALDGPDEERERELRALTTIRRVRSNALA